MPNPQYTPYGPFTNGGSPGISAAFLNALETFLVAVNTVATDPQVSALASPGGYIVAQGLSIVTGNLELQPLVHTTINGSTSGTLVFQEYFGVAGNTPASLKLVTAWFNNYKNAGSAQSQVLNVPFNVGAFIASMGGNGLQLWGSGTQLSDNNMLTTLGGSAAGAQTTSNVLQPWSIGQAKHPFDTIREPGGNVSSATGIAFLLGF